MRYHPSTAALLSALLLATQSAAFAVPSDGTSSTAKLTEAKGAIFKRSFIDWNKEVWGQPEPAKVGDTLQEGMQLGTGEKSWAQLSWKYITTRAWENSVYAIAPNQRLVYLVGGEMLFHLDKHRKDKQEYYVWTNLLQARIRGTTVMVQSTADTSRISVLEGTIDVLNRSDHSVVRLKPGVVYEVKSKDSLGPTTQSQMFARTVASLPGSQPFSFNRASLTAPSISNASTSITRTISPATNTATGITTSVTPGPLGISQGLLGGSTANSVLGTANGLTGSLLGSNGLVGGLVGNNGLVGGLLGSKGLVGGLLGSNGAVGSLLGSNGLVGGLLGNNSLLALGGNGAGSVVGNSGVLGGLLGSGSGTTAGITHGLLGGTSGILGGTGSGITGGLVSLPNMAQSINAPSFTQLVNSNQTATPIYETTKTLVTLYAVNPQAVLKAPEVTGAGFQSFLPSTGLINEAMSQLPASDKVISLNSSIVRVPVSLSYNIGPAVGKTVAVPTTSLLNWPPTAYIGQVAPDVPTGLAQVTASSKTSGNTLDKRFASTVSQLPINAAILGPSLPGGTGAPIPTNILGNLLNQAGGGSTGGLGSIAGLHGGTGTFSTGSIIGALPTLGGTIGSGTTPGSGGLVGGVGGTVGGVGGTVGGVVGGVGGTVGGVVGGVGGVVGGVGGTVGGVVGGVGGTVGGVVGGVGGVVGGIVGGVTGGVHTPPVTLPGRGVVGGLGGTVGGLLGGLGHH